VYALREAFRGMIRTPYMTLLSIVTITVTLTVLGAFGVATLFAHGALNKVRKSEEINVYLKDSMTDGDMLALDAVIAAMTEVESTRILSKEDARKEFEKMFGPDLLATIDENPLPRTIVVTMAEGFTTSDDLDTVASRIMHSNGVESVEYGREWMSKLDLVFVLFIIGETALVLLAVAACTLVISNTISMTVLARKDTIEIMRLVGATDGFIRRPFYVEGLVQGLLSGTATFGILYGVWRWLLHVAPDIDAYIYMFALPRQLVLSNEFLIAFIIPIGGFLGLIGSFTAVRRIF